MNIDEEFLLAFRNGSLPFDQWTHRAHIRMAYLVCQKSTSFDQALEQIRKGIQNFNSLHLDKLKIGFHETMTEFWTRLIWNTSRNSNVDFNTFIEQNQYLLNSSLWKEYYSPTLMFSLEAKGAFVYPDLQSIENLQIQ